MQLEDLKHQVVKDQNRRSVPVMNLVQMAEIYVVQSSDNICITKNGEYSLKTFGPGKFSPHQIDMGENEDHEKVDFRTLSDTMDTEEVMRRT